MNLRHITYVGAARSVSFTKTISIISEKLKKLSSLKGERLLDVGCGDGSFTIPLSVKFKEVYGIDVQEHYLDSFRMKVIGDERFNILRMSASDMEFPASYFDTIVSIETIKHIPNLRQAVYEFSRVIKVGGELLLTCPNRWFLVENPLIMHGQLLSMGGISCNHSYAISFS